MDKQDNLLKPLLQPPNLLKPNLFVTDYHSVEASPDYAGLVRFLIAPFLESADALKVDCEIAPRPRRVLIRLAFEGEDKGRVFGRGGRNIQAVRTILQAVAQTVDYTAHLDIYGTQSDRPSGESAARPRASNGGASPDRPRRPPRPRPPA